MTKKIHVGNGAVVPTAASTIRYIAETKKAKPLSRDTEAALTRAAQAGDTAAQNRMVEAHLRFVIQVARQYQGMGLQLEDLIAFGNIGLFEAVERFNPERGVKFITFAVWYIRAEIQKALNDLSRTVRIPSHKTATEEYSTKSIHTPVGEDENKESWADRYLEAEAVKTSADRADLQFDLQRVFGTMKPKEAEAVRRFYGIGFEYSQCMEQIAEEMAITGERARQLVRSGEKAVSASGKILEKYL